MRIFLDANILFSAARNDGPMRQLLRELQAKSHALVASAAVVFEARRNLEAKSTVAAVNFLDQLVAEIDVPPYAPGSVAAALTNWLPDTDQHVLAAAIRQHCEILVTGDKAHFGSRYGKKFAHVLIVSPRMAAEILLNAHSAT